ncbi:RHS repeat-associated core domain-containing protein [Kitasatospora sp. NPDC058115]|uniref:RHS repeat-associated core domain-containing protein n=1 Tax=Kitasatospora sp. NPDC058115 TaxID=3346347 RepID=UPI0036DDB026
MRRPRWGLAARLAAFGMLVGGLTVPAGPAGAATAPCSAESRTVTDYKGRPFPRIYHCATYVAQTMFANIQDAAPLDDVTAMNLGSDIWGVCQVQGRANPVIQGNTNTWWLYTQGDAVNRDNNYGYTNAWGFLPATALVQGEQNAPVPGVPVCATDYAVPGAPGVASAKYPADGTWSGGAGEAGSFTLTPVTGTTDLAGFVYGLDTNPPGTFVPATGPVTVTVTPSAVGPHTLHVRTKDKAGNLSPVTRYTFRTGRGAVTSPADGRRTPGRVPLSAAFTPEHTQVRFEYRRGEADAWRTVPAADTVLAASGTAVTWPVATTGGVSPDLQWDVARSLPEDGTIDLRAVFTAATGSSPTEPVRLVLDRGADGAATEEIGPGSVNLLTGDFELTTTDASALDLAVSRTASSREPDAGARQEGQVAPFGPQWTTGGVAQAADSDYVQLRRTSPTSVEVVRTDGSVTGFTATAAGAWTPEPGAEALTLTGTLSSGGFTLARTDGTVTTFEKVDPAAPTYPVRTTAPATPNSTVLHIAEKVVGGDGTVRARPVRMIAPTPALANLAVCNTASGVAPPRGCKVLDLVYATATTATATALGDRAGQVREARVWATDPADGVVKASSVARYAYDAEGRLRETWDPRITPALKTAYAYDDAGRVTGLTPPGELPWTFTYGRAGNPATAGDGMLLKASRPTLVPGSADRTDGTGAVSVVYDVPVAGPGAPYAMGATDIAGWGQGARPVDATAVFPADQVPASATGRGALGSGDYRRATVHYLDVDGRSVNTAQPGGHLSTVEYDRAGRTVRELSAADRALALGQGAGAAARLAELGLLGLDTDERARQLSELTLHDAAGGRVTETLGPLHTVALADGLAAADGLPAIPPGGRTPARRHVVNTYDTGRPTDGSAVVEDLVTRVDTGASVPGYPVDADVRATATGYDWTTGQPVRNVQDPNGLALTRTTGYDAAGRVVRSGLPASDGSDAGTTVTAYWTAEGTGECAGRPEWAGLVCRTAPAGPVAGGQGNPQQLVTKTITYDRWGQQATITETANGVSRTTANTFDDAGRETRSAVTGGSGTPVAETTTQYDPATGRRAGTTASTGGTVLREYDLLGRLLAYTDADGGRTAFGYDALDRPVRVTDSAPSSTTYSYDTVKEPRGLVTGLSDSVAGAFTASYDAAGRLSAATLPGGVSLEQAADETGQPVRRSYTRNGAVLLADAVTPTVHGQWSSRSGPAAVTYRYDRAGRLTTVDETANGGCTRRTYAFDRNSNRTAGTTAATAAGSCATTGGSTETYAYDTADRLVGTGYAYDAFGRTTSLPGGTAIQYHVNDRVRSQTSGSTRQTWELDPAMRPRSWVVQERAADGSWTTSAGKVNHYGSEDDSPRWIVEDRATGAITRNVVGIDGNLAATTSAGGDVRVQLTGLHGDVDAVLDAAGGTVTTRATDEYGVPAAGQPPAARYGWLGQKQRSAEAQGGTLLMGVRLYAPALGRFLQVDGALGGNANAYEYCNGDAVNCTDTTGYGGCSLWGRLCGQVLNLSRSPVRIARDWNCHGPCPSPQATLRPGMSSRSFYSDTDGFKTSTRAYVTIGFNVGWGTARPGRWYQIHNLWAPHIIW